MSASFIWIAWCSRDRLAERLAFLRVADRGVERGARHAARAGRDVDAADLERGEDVAEPGPSPASRRARESAGTRWPSYDISTVSMPL